MAQDKVQTALSKKWVTGSFDFTLLLQAYPDMGQIQNENLESRWYFPLLGRKINKWDPLQPFCSGDAYISSLVGNLASHSQSWGVRVHIWPRDHLPVSIWEALYQRPGYGDGPADECCVNECSRLVWNIPNISWL